MDSENVILSEIIRWKKSRMIFHSYMGHQTTSNKGTNKTNKQKLINIDSSTVVPSGKKAGVGR